MAGSDYHQKLNDWHLQLAICCDALSFVVRQIDADGLSDCASLAIDRFVLLLETCPFPDGEEVSL